MTEVERALISALKGCLGILQNNYDDLDSYGRRQVARAYEAIAQTYRREADDDSSGCQHQGDEQ
jgi:hypothetical protein